MEEFPQVERELLVQSARLISREEYLAWEERCSEYIEYICVGRTQPSETSSIIDRCSTIAGYSNRAARRTEIFVARTFCA